MKMFLRVIWYLYWYQCHARVILKLSFDCLWIIKSSVPYLLVMVVYVYLLSVYVELICCQNNALQDQEGFGDVII